MSRLLNVLKQKYQKDVSKNASKSDYLFCTHAVTGPPQNFAFITGSHFLNLS